MNTKTNIVAVVLLLVAAGGYYFINNNQSDTSAVVENENSQLENIEDFETGQKGKGSLMGLMGLGQNTMCIFSYSDANTGQTNSGEFYFDGSNEIFRVDSLTQEQGVVHVMHMINDSESLYMWSEAEGDSFAIKMPAEAQIDVNSQDLESPESNKPLSMDQEVEYDCDSWRVDSNLFVPPSSIEFTNMAEMMNGMMGGVPEGFTLPEGFPGQ